MSRELAGWIARRVLRLSANQARPAPAIPLLVPRTTPVLSVASSMLFWLMGAFSNERCGVEVSRCVDEDWAKGSVS